MDGWMDGWFGHCKGRLPGTQGAKLWLLNVPTSKHLFCSVPIGFADPRDLCGIEHVTRQLMVGNFKRPPSPDPCTTLGQLEAPRAP